VFDYVSSFLQGGVSFEEIKTYEILTEMAMIMTVERCDWNSR
jgi:hypothetical protein